MTTSTTSWTSTTSEPCSVQGGRMTSYAGRFAGKVAVVTGAAQGIGRTVALRIAREGGSPAATHPAQRRGAERSREGMAPPGATL